MSNLDGVGEARPPRLVFDGGVVDLSTGIVSRDAGAPTALTPRERALLRALWERLPRPCAADWLLGEVWGRRWDGSIEDLAIVRNTISKLRNKIERDPRRPSVIVTEVGAGYRIAPDPIGAAGWPRSAPGEPSAELCPPPGGGYDSTWDVGFRSAEREARLLLATSGHIVSLIGPRLSGKSWLLQRLLRGLGDTDTVAMVDPAQEEPDALRTPRQVYAVIGAAIEAAVPGVRLDPDAARAVASPPRAVARWLADEVLPRLPGRLVLGFEDVDRVPDGARGELMALLNRIAAGERPREGARLRVLVTATRPVSCMHLPGGGSPGRAAGVWLRGLEQDAVAALAARQGLALSAEQLATIHTSTGGHAWLCRLCLCEARRAGVERALSEAGLRGLASRAFRELRGRLPQGAREAAAASSFDELRARLDDPCDACPRDGHACGGLEA